MQPLDAPLGCTLPPDAPTRQKTDCQQALGTHHTEMHSCLNFLFATFAIWVPTSLGMVSGFVSSWQKILQHLSIKNKPRHLDLFILPSKMIGTWRSLYSWMLRLTDADIHNNKRKWAWATDKNKVVKWNGDHFYFRNYGWYWCRHELLTEFLSAC